METTLINIETLLKQLIDMTWAIIPMIGLIFGALVVSFMRFK